MEARCLEWRERRVDKMRLERYERMEIMLASGWPKSLLPGLTAMRMHLSDLQIQRA